MKTLEEVLRDWEAVIGLEVHTELTVCKSKMFCSCPLEFGAPANTHTCPVCLGLPGALPVPNRHAIECIVKAGLATSCSISKRSLFYRKNYFYPDMSKNFQITQGPIAFCMAGALDLDIDKPDAGLAPYSTRIRINRIHMEEDAGKMVHMGAHDGRIAGASQSLVDYNRCGTPLIELVTEPDLRSPEEARCFMRKLRSIFLAIGISDCSMEEGSMRCDGNVSLRRRGESSLGTKTELKNINSFKSLHDALEYEIIRQAEVLEAGGIIRQETRHFDLASKRSICMRSKETADDYRLFPDPDLAPFDLSDEFIEEIRAGLPELPDAKRARYISDYALPPKDAAPISEDPALSAFFEEALRSSGDKNAPRIAILLLNDCAAYQKESGLSLAQLPFSPAQLASLAALLDFGEISSKQGKQLFSRMCQSGDDPAAIIDELGLRLVSDSAAIDAAVDAVIAANPDKVAAYRGGKTGLMGFFVGQVMKQMQGQGDPRMINQSIAAKLDSEN